MLKWLGRGRGREADATPAALIPEVTVIPEVKLDPEKAKIGFAILLREARLGNIPNLPQKSGESDMDTTARMLDRAVWRNPQLEKYGDIELGAPFNPSFMQEYLLQADLALDQITALIAKATFATLGRRSAVRTTDKDSNDREFLTPDYWDPLRKHMLELIAGKEYREAYQDIIPLPLRTNAQTTPVLDELMEGIAAIRHTSNFDSKIRRAYDPSSVGLPMLETNDKARLWNGNCFHPQEDLPQSLAVIDEAADEFLTIFERGAIIFIPTAGSNDTRATIISPALTYEDQQQLDPYYEFLMHLSHDPINWNQTIGVKEGGEIPPILELQYYFGDSKTLENAIKQRVFGTYANLMGKTLSSGTLIIITPGTIGAMEKPFTIGQREYFGLKKFFADRLKAKLEDGKIPARTIREEDFLQTNLGVSSVRFLEQQAYLNLGQFVNLFFETLTHDAALITRPGETLPGDDMSAQQIEKAAEELGKTLAKLEARYFLNR